MGERGIRLKENRINVAEKHPFALARATRNQSESNTSIRGNAWSILIKKCVSGGHARDGDWRRKAQPKAATLNRTEQKA